MKDSEIKTLIKTIKEIKELPSWFKLKKYDATSTLDGTGWYEQLSIRNSLYKSLLRKNSEVFSITEQDLEVLEALRKNPIVDINNCFVMKVLFCDALLWELKSGEPRYSLGVHMTSVREHYLTEKDIEDEKRTYARNFFNQNFGDDFLEEACEPIKYPHQDWIDDPIDNIRSSADFNVHLNIDMGLPDKVLIDQFKQFLIDLRSPLKEAGISIDNKLRPDFEGWTKFAILPYLDLSAWAEIEGMKISNRTMADAIFLKGEGGEEVVRKTTKKIAEEILTKGHLNKLAAIAANEIMERNSG